MRQPTHVSQKPTARRKPRARGATAGLVFSAMALASCGGTKWSSGSPIEARPSKKETGSTRPGGSKAKEGEDDLHKKVVQGNGKEGGGQDVPQVEQDKGTPKENGDGQGPLATVVPTAPPTPEGTHPPTKQNGCVAEARADVVRPSENVLVVAKGCHAGDTLTVMAKSGPLAVPLDPATPLSIPASDLPVAQKVTVIDVPIEASRVSLAWKSTAAGGEAKEGTLVVHALPLARSPRIEQLRFPSDAPARNGYVAFLLEYANLFEGEEVSEWALLAQSADFRNAGCKRVRRVDQAAPFKSRVLHKETWACLSAFTTAVYDPNPAVPVVRGYVGMIASASVLAGGTTQTTQTGISLCVVPKEEPGSPTYDCKASTQWRYVPAVGTASKASVVDPKVRVIAVVETGLAEEVTAVWGELDALLRK